MVGRTNVGGGGSVQEAFAFIHVTFPDTTTSCTATKTDGSSSITLVAHGTTNLEEGQLHYMFCVPESGAWNISATNGTKTATATCVMLIRNQLNEVTLRFGRIPDAYQEVQYIQTISRAAKIIWLSGSENDKHQQNTEFDIEYMVPATNHNGGDNTTNLSSHDLLKVGNMYSITIGSNYVFFYESLHVWTRTTGTNYGYYSNNTDGVTSEVAVDTKHTIVFNNSNYECLVDGVSADQLTPNRVTATGWTLADYPVYTFEGGSTESNAHEVRLYSVVQKDNSNDTIVHNWVPCYRRSDNTIGVYDLTTGTFKACENSSYFIVGPNY